ncbi:MAG: hypothetical protein ABIK44_01710 [candidate division WOR-3 bacterium]
MKKIAGVPKWHTMLLAVTVSLLLTVGLMGCRQKENDEESIRNLLNGSSYTDESQTRGYSSQDSTLAPGGEPGLGPGADGYETIPFVRFRRFVPQGGISRSILVQIPAYPGYPDTTALATITSDIHGEFRTLFDTTTHPMLVWRKPFHDQAVRRVYLTKGPDGWHIRKVSPLNITTVDAAYELRLVSIHVQAASGEVFELTTADTLLAKDELPTFVPGDTVHVQVTVQSSGDSCWVFLHHGRREWPHRWRRPYFKTGTFTFERTWSIGSEGFEVPEVRPSAHDAIGWNSLWADTSQPYVAAAWGLPYIVKQPNEAIPEE